MAEDIKTIITIKNASNTRKILGLSVNIESGDVRISSKSISRSELILVHAFLLDCADSIEALIEDDETGKLH